MPPRVKPESSYRITTPDLVVLALLSERPMHGYEVVTELERREVKDWAGISRPQVYYSLQKLATNEFIREVADKKAAGGPERRVYTPTSAGKKAMSAALAREEWTTERPPLPFVTWACLSLHVSSDVAKTQIERRRVFLQEQIAKERTTLVAIAEDTGPMIPIALSVVKFGLAQFAAELSWLDELEKVLT